MPKATLSAALIVQDEAANLAACLEGLTWADEIIVLDGGSSDATVDIARRYTDQVHTAADWQGFGVQRQRAQAYAQGDWMLWIDADERMTPALQAEIQAVVQANDQSKVYALPRLPWCFGRFIRHGGWYPSYAVRLYPRRKAGFGAERVHERVHYTETLQRLQLKEPLLHYTYRDLEHYLVKSAAYAREWAEQRRAAGKSASLSRGVAHGLGCFVKMYLLRAGFLDGRQGLLMALLSAHSTFAKYADLWIRSRTPDDADG